MMRGLLLALVAANLLFLAWSQGWLAPTWPGPHTVMSEPLRLANQVRPEWVQVVPPVILAASAASSAEAGAGDNARTCLEAGPFSTEAAERAEASLRAVRVPEQAWSSESRAIDAGPGVVVNEIWLRAAQAPAALQQQLLALSAAEWAGGFKPCR